MDKFAQKHGTQKIAKAYLEYLYSDEGQAIAARHYYRPRSQKAAESASVKLPQLQLFTIDEVFGGWQKAQKTHFADGGIFDKIYQPSVK